MSMQAAAVLVAAGSSTRMRPGASASPAPDATGSVRKPLIELAGRSLLELACAPFDALAEVVEIVVVAHADDVRTIDELREARPALKKVSCVVPGGAERADSVRIGCRAVTLEVDVLAVHDAARPFASAELVRRTLAAALEEGAALPALPVHDTLKASTDGRHAERTVDRSGLFAAQTPQCFRRARFLELLARAEHDGFRPTDDAALWERYAGPVALVPGDPRNRKVTTPEDLELARALLAGERD